MLPAMHFIPHVEDATRALFSHLCLMLSQTSPREHLQCVCLPSMASCFCPSICFWTSLRNVTHAHAVHTTTPMRAYSVAHLLAIQIRVMELRPQNVLFFLPGNAILVTLLLIFSQLHLWHLPFIATGTCDSFTLCCLSPYCLTFSPIVLPSVPSRGSQSVALN